MIIPEDDLYCDQTTGCRYGLPMYTTLEILRELSLINEIKSKIELKIFTLITDLFFLRRFLDKDYIINGIIYSGISHSINYVFILLKLFDFKVTNFSYLKEKPELVFDIVIKSKESSDIASYIYPPKFRQCSNMTNFPKLFE